MYFDNNATTMVHPSIIGDLIKNMTSDYGNPSCTHNMGVEASYSVEKARTKIATKLGTLPENIIFTSGASESVSLALNREYPYRYIISKVEHECVLNKVRRSINIYDEIPILKNGLLCTDTLLKLIMEDDYRENETIFSLLLVSNETGNILFDAKKVVDIIRSSHSTNFIHLDLTQAIGKTPINLDEMDIDAASFSGHKLHAPKGVGALYVKDPNKLKSNTIVFGGGQEKGLRGGTENVPSIVAFGKAVELACDNINHYQLTVSSMRSYILDGLVSIMGTNGFKFKLLTNIEDSVVNTLFFGYSHDGIVDVKHLIDYLSDNDVYVSTGSACNSNNPECSKIVKALGLEKEIGSNTIRISLSCFNTMVEVCRFVDIFKRYFTERYYKA